MKIGIIGAGQIGGTFAVPGLRRHGVPSADEIVKSKSEAE
jgi:hypothetical protein